MPVSLKDQVVLILGASSGIGRETAVLFAREGARVLASARRGDRLRSLQDQLGRKDIPSRSRPRMPPSRPTWSSLPNERWHRSEKSTSWSMPPARTHRIAPWIG